MATYVLPLELEERLNRFAAEQHQSPDESLIAIASDFFAEYEADRMAGGEALQRLREYDAGNDCTYTLAEMMREDGLEG